MANTQGFTFNDFKNEIDAGRPVMIHVIGHTMVGYGYDDIGSIIYIHDTWNYNEHTMSWGGSYIGMTHWGVSVLRLDDDGGGGGGGGGGSGGCFISIIK